MRFPGPASLVAFASLLVAVPASQAASVGPGQMTLIRKAVAFKIEGKTGRPASALKLSCTERNPQLTLCNGSWRDRRASYEGRFFVFDDEDSFDVAFAGVRTDRACAAKRSGAQKRLCRDVFVF